MIMSSPRRDRPDTGKPAPAKKITRPAPPDQKDADVTLTEEQLRKVAGGQARTGRIG
jgi:hypothetical protein